ncbi:MAG: hypothetical protein H6709_16285, partial [Kofleriaceae bacterium]|nr:hypothetical protein [Kofleriaceae bacterium]
TTLGGCKGKDKHASDDTGVVRVADVKAERAQARRAATAACIDGLATPAPPGALDGGLGALLDRCQVCGVSWQPVVALSRIDPDDGPGPDVPPADRAIAVLDACDALCSTRAREEIAGPMRDAAAGQAPSQPWRKLAEVCPDVMGTDARTIRFARGTWFALAEVGRALWSPDVTAAQAARRDAAALEFPLPPYSQVSTAVALPESDVLAPWLPRIGVTIAATELHVGALPWVEVTDGKLALVPAPGDAYPGVNVPLPSAAAALGDLRGALTGSKHRADADLSPVLLAPRAMPAARVLEVMAALPGPQFLAATRKTRGAEPWAEPLGAIPVSLAAGPAPAGVPRIAPTGLGADAATEIQSLLAEAEGHRDLSVLVLPAGATVSYLADALGAMHAGGVTTAIVVQEPAR